MIFERKIKKKVKKFLDNRNAWIRIQAHEQEYQAIGQEVQEIELDKRSQVLPQDLSIAHDFLDQDSQVSPAQTKRSSSRVYFL